MGVGTAAPTTVTAFLFTDIEGSTRRWEADPEAMRVELESHDQTLREAVEKHHGCLFKHTGDGVCAAFTSSRAAVDAAIAAQRVLRLPVRMGIATGEAEARGDDYFGAVLNRAARVMAAGHGGQILLDGATAGLLTDVELISLGTRRLRDIAKPVQMFQACASGLGTDFPPLRTESAPGNLRQPSTSLVGRESELAAIEDTLKAHRLVTLTGVGGVGKTRLALEVAARLADSFPDGVWVIEFAAVGDPAAIPEAAAAVLGITQQPGMNMAHSVAAALEGRSRLLVFDNCEHVLDAAADLIETIFAHSATVKILATSREGLRVPNEQLWPVASLDAGSSAATLFVERAHAALPDIALDNTAVVEICRRLDGIPLAIELAASRTVSMTATEVRDRLDDRFRLLVGARRGLERHQTLRHAVQWSYDLLSIGEKTLLARCSVFAGGFDLAAACSVATSDDELTTLDLLDALVRKSLLIADRTSARTRFSMLETIRQFAEEQLVASGDADAVRTTHARYFAGLESKVLALWDSPRQREAYEWFDRELANLRAAFRWAADQGDLDAAAALAVSAGSLGYYVEQWEPIAWAEELIPSAEAVRHPRLAQLYTVATNCAVVGRVDDFARYAAAARKAIEACQFDDVSDELANMMAAGYSTTGHPERAVEWCRALCARSQGSHFTSQVVLAVSLAITGATTEALAESENLLAAADNAANPTLAGAALLGYGWARRETDPTAAYDALRRALSVADQCGDRQQASIIAGLLAGLAATHGDVTDALGYISQMIRHYYDSGSVELMRNAIGLLTALLDRLGYHEPAATISGFAARALARTSFPEIDTAITHLRTVLGDEAYETFARRGERMTNAELVGYAFDQIDRARAGG